MRKFIKIRLLVISAVILAAAGYVTYLCFNYFFYRDYEKYLTGYTYENGSEFKPLEDGGPAVAGMVLAAENDCLKLYTNLKTTEIAVYDKRSGEITYSNPPDRDNDPVANGQNKIALNSQLVLTYYDSTMTETAMYNYDYSVERGQFKIEKLKDGIRYIYLFGDLTNPTGIVPPLISKERLDEKVLRKLDEKDAKTVRNSYVESKTHPGFFEITSGVRVSKVGMQKLNKIFESAGYTADDFDEDAARAAGGESSERTTFSIPLEYRLKGDRLETTIPTSHIAETGSGRLTRIDMLCFFGAGGSDEEGYMLVPNGSGSLINFNNGKTEERYNQYVYGIDETMRSFTVVEESEKARLPVFGIKKEKSAVFAEITNGDMLANIIAMVSGNKNSYNYVYPSFIIRGSEKVSMFGASGVSADVPVLEKNFYSLDIKVAYAFLNGEDANYSGMAKYYRNKLINQGVLSVKEKEESLPFYLDIVGGVQRRESFLGIPCTGVYPMTTFDEAGLIVDAFNKQGVTNLRVNYLGWFNGGYYHDVAEKIRVDGVLGGKKGLRRLDEKLKSTGGRLFGDVAMQQVSFESEDCYNWRMENAQYYSGLAVGLGRTNPATLRMSGMGYPETLYNVMSPKYLPRYTSKFLNAIKNAGIYGISFRDMGDMAPSDKRRSNIINRQESKEIIVGQLKRMREQIGNLMLSGGNSYSWAYSSDLVNVPSGDNPFIIVDEEVPFYQMVLHGCIDYAGDAINIGGHYDKRDIVLKMIEFGMAPHYVLSYEDSSKIKYTGLNFLYSTQYRIWLKDAVDIYRQADNVLRHVSGSVILEHKAFNDGVKRITYGNGCVIYINPNGTAVSLDGVDIPAKGCILEGYKK